MTKWLRIHEIYFQLIPCLQREINVWKDAHVFWQLYLLFQRKKFDLIHNHLSRTSFFERVAGWLAGGVRIIQTVQGLPLYPGIDGLLLPSL